MALRKLWPVALAIVLLAGGCGQPSLGGAAANAQNRTVAGNPAAAGTDTNGTVTNTPAGAQTTHGNPGSSPSSQVTWPTVMVKPVGKLPVGMVGNALSVAPDGSVFSVGGYTGLQSLQNVYQVAGGVVTPAGLLPQPTHDAAAGFLGSNLYVFGGGQNASYNTIVQVHGRQVRTIDHLAQPLSDAVSVPLVYRGQPGLVLVGGYDGQVFQREVRFVTISHGKLVWTNLFLLPQGLRYASVSVLANTLYIAGGKYSSGQLSPNVYAWSETKPSLRLVGRFAVEIEKAALFAIPGYLVLAGGLNPARNPQSDIVAMNVKTGKTRVIGHLPGPLADFGYTQVGQRGFLAGGMKSASETDTNQVIYALSFP